MANNQQNQNQRIRPPGGPQPVRKDQRAQQQQFRNFQVPQFFPQFYDRPIVTRNSNYNNQPANFVQNGRKNQKKRKQAAKQGKKTQSADSTPNNDSAYTGSSVDGYFKVIGEKKFRISSTGAPTRNTWRTLESTPNGTVERQRFPPGNLSTDATVVGAKIITLQIPSADWTDTVTISLRIQDSRIGVQSGQLWRKPSIEIKQVVDTTTALINDMYARTMSDESVV